MQDQEEVSPCTYLEDSLCFRNLSARITKRFARVISLYAGARILSLFDRGPHLGDSEARQVSRLRSLTVFILFASGNSNIQVEAR